MGSRGDQPIILAGWNARFYGENPQGALSVKAMFDGRAVYRTADGRAFGVDDDRYLILNAGTPYSVEKPGPTRTETFCVFFPPAFTAEALRSLTAPAGRLLDAPFAGPPALAPDAGPRFFETTHAHDRQVSPILQRLRAAHRQGASDRAWREDHLHALIDAMLDKEGQLKRRAERLSALRPATRVELQHRLHLARDHMAAQLDRPHDLRSLSRVAAISPHHLRRSFAELFGRTPQVWLSEQRLARSRLLLRRSDLPITEVCHAVGYRSLGSFSTWFRNRMGCSPSAYRRSDAA